MQRKKGGRIFNNKNAISHDLFFNVFELILATIVIIALFKFVNDVAEQTIFAKNYFARDMSLLVNALYAAPGKVTTYTYDEDTSGFIFDFKDNRLTVYEDGDSVDNRNIFYLYAENKNFPFHDATLTPSEGEKIKFSKSYTVNPGGLAIDDLIQIQFGTAGGFFNALQDSHYFDGFTDAFLWGLTANAFHESGFRADANGDSRGSGDDGAIQVDNNGYYCSFGYWQLNVCGGEGRGFISYYGINADDKAGVHREIIEQDNQFQFIAKRMKELFPLDYNGGSKSAGDFGREIAIRFERCTECGESGEQTRLRGELAARYSRDSSLILPLPTEPTTGPAAGLVNSLYKNQLPIENSGIRPPGRVVDRVILHHSGGANAQTTFNTLRDRRLSAHYIIARDGTIYQLLDEERMAYHAGPVWNPRSIGIEIDNTGFADMQYTDNQYDSINRLLRDITARLSSINYDNEHIIAHYQATTEGKWDPSPNFNWAMINLPNHPTLALIGRPVTCCG